VKLARIVLLVIAAAIGVVAVTRASLSSAPGLALTLLMLAGFSLGLARFRWAMALGGVLSATPLLIAAVNIALDAARGRALPHPLLLDLASMIFVGMLPGVALLGGWAIRLTFDVPAYASWAAAYATCALAIGSGAFTHAMHARSQAFIGNTLRRLWEAEKAYAAGNPRHSYACDGRKLPGFEHEPWTGDMCNHLHASSGYVFSLDCGGGARLIVYGSSAAGECYWIDASGVVHHATANNAAGLR